MSWGKGRRQPLRFSKYGNPYIEELYSTHYVSKKLVKQAVKEAGAEKDKAEKPPATAPQLATLVEDSPDGSQSAQADRLISPESPNRIQDENIPF